MILIGGMVKDHYLKFLLVFLIWRPKPKKAKAQEAQVHPMRGKAKH